MAKILLVEDDKSLREIYGVRLSAEGYEIASAGDGEEALAIASKEKPDLVICDVMMPKISGFDVLDILRATPATKDMKVIMMTALSSDDQRARGEALGADRYLVKSQVGIEDVIRTVHEVLADAPVAPTAPLTTVPAPTPQETPALEQPAPIAPSSPVPEPVVTSEPPVAPVEEQPLPPAPQSDPLPPAPSTIPQPPAPAPAEPVVPIQPQPLPQPTAPFSSPAPESLGEQVTGTTPPTPQPTPLGPITPPVPTDNNIANRIQQELSGEMPAPATEPAEPMPPTPPPA